MKAHSGRQHSDDELQSVADVYRSAFKKSLPVQQTVAETLGIPLSTATKRIMAARRKGLIPKRKGGAPLRVDPKGRERASARLVFALTPTQLAALQAKAKRRGVKVSVLVRELVMK